MSRPAHGDAPTAVSEAEARAFGGTDAETQRPFGDLARRAAAVTTAGWWIECGGPVVTIIRSRSSARSSRARTVAHRDGVTVALAAGQHDVATVAHELAHALAGVGHGHDARFRTAAVDVATIVITPDAGSALAAAFADFGLDRLPRPWPSPWRMAGDGFRVGFDVDPNPVIG